MKKLKLEVGKYYKTYGGWKALVIWESARKDFIGRDFYVIHKPEDQKNESCPILHSCDGEALSAFSVEVNEPPRYNQKHHPADIKQEWKEQLEKEKISESKGNTR